MKRVLGILLLVVLLGMSSAQADRARFLRNDGNSSYHAQHLQMHIGSQGCRISANYLKVRRSAGSSSVIGHVEQADLVRLLSVEGNWAYIQVEYSASTSPDSWGGLQGYVDADYLECPCDERTYYSGGIYSGAQAVTTGSGVNLRELPSTGARSLATVSRGTRVTTYGVYQSGDNGFTRVVLPSGQNGFVMNKYLETTAYAPVESASSGYSSPRSAPASQTGSAIYNCIGTELARVRSGRLRVRETPGGRIIGMIGPNDRFVLHEVENGWGEIEVTVPASSESYQGLFGWVDVSYLTAAGGQQTPSAGNSWQRLYYEYVMANGGDSAWAVDEYSGYSLIYVDNDNIPELVMCSGFEAGGNQILTCSSGHVEALQTDRLQFSYMERENRVLNNDGNMGYYYDRVYAIQNGKWVQIGNGEYTGDRVDWINGRAVNADFTWNGMPVGVDDYYRMLYNCYDTNRARSTSPQSRSIRALLGI